MSYGYFVTVKGKKRLFASEEEYLESIEETEEMNELLDCMSKAGSLHCKLKELAATFDFETGMKMVDTLAITVKELAGAKGYFVFKKPNGPDSFECHLEIKNKEERCLMSQVFTRQHFKSETSTLIRNLTMNYYVLVGNKKVKRNNSEKCVDGKCNACDFSGICIEETAKAEIKQKVGA